MYPCCHGGRRATSWSVDVLSDVDHWVQYWRLPTVGGLVDGASLAGHEPLARIGTNPRGARDPATGSVATAADLRQSLEAKCPDSRVETHRDSSHRLGGWEHRND